MAIIRKTLKSTDTDPGLRSHYFTWTYPLTGRLAEPSNSKTQNLSIERNITEKESLTFYTTWANNASPHAFFFNKTNHANMLFVI